VGPQPRAMSLFHLRLLAATLGTESSLVQTMSLHHHVSLPPPSS
jgi:hypothetical protein